MNLLLHIPLETEAKLIAQAAETGQSPEARALEEQLADAPSAPAATSAEEWIARVRAWAESHPRLPFEADDSRESIYAGRGE